MSSVLRPLIFSMVLLGLLGAPGCSSGIDESNFSPNPTTVAPDAPKSPAEYDARYPVK